jgi:hypothetical protein
MWQDEENDPYQGIVSHRAYDNNAMREFPAPIETDPGLEGGADDLPGLQDPGFIGDIPHWEEASMQQRDPRIDAIEQMASQGQVQRPGMKTEQDLEAFGQQHGMPSERDRLTAPPRRTIGDMMGMPYGGQGTPDEVAEADATAKMTDEDLLNQVQKQIEPPPDVMTPKDKGPFTGDYDEDLLMLNKAFRTPGVDANALEEIFNEMYPDEEKNDREMDPPTDERDMRSGRQ